MDKVFFSIQDLQNVTEETEPEYQATRSTNNMTVSQFPVPPKPVNPNRKRGAELNKIQFIKKMDKLYISIKRLLDIEEIDEPQRPATKSHRNTENEKISKFITLTQSTQPQNNVTVNFGPKENPPKAPTRCTNNDNNVIVPSQPTMPPPTRSP